jgi:hypothetical protein
MLSLTIRLKKSDLSRFVFIFNWSINNLNFFRWGRFAQQRGGGLCTTTKAYLNAVFEACGQFVVFLYEGNVYPRKCSHFRNGGKSEAVEVAREARYS